MNDAELQWFCKQYSVSYLTHCTRVNSTNSPTIVQSVKKHALEDKAFLDAGKITRLLALLAQYQTENKRVLIFSQVSAHHWSTMRSAFALHNPGLHLQFTQVLEILKVILDMQKIRYLVLTGQTAVNERQTLVDEFNEDEDIPVFLLSTRAGESRSQPVLSQELLLNE